MLTAQVQQLTGRSVKKGSDTSGGINCHVRRSTTQNHPDNGAKNRCCRLTQNAQDGTHWLELMATLELRSESYVII